MKLVFAKEPIESSIFLAGPTPRDPATPSWRPYALELLDSFGYQGVVYIPEDRFVSDYQFEYDAQIRWEWEALSVAKTIAFWVPRELNVMPAFTTNVEFGLYASSGKCIFGAPPDAPKNNYLRALAGRYNIETVESLQELMLKAIQRPITNKDLHDHHQLYPLFPARSSLHIVNLEENSQY